MQSWEDHEAEPVGSTVFEYSTRWDQGLALSEIKVSGDLGGFVASGVLRESAYAIWRLPPTPHRIPGTFHAGIPNLIWNSVGRNSDQMFTFDRTLGIVQPFEVTDRALDRLLNSPSEESLPVQQIGNCWLAAGFAAVQIADRHALRRRFRDVDFSLDSSSVTVDLGLAMFDQQGDVVSVEPASVVVDNWQLGHDNRPLYGFCVDSQIAWPIAEKAAAILRGGYHWLSWQRPNAHSLYTTPSRSDGRSLQALAMFANTIPESRLYPSADDLRKLIYAAHDQRMPLIVATLCDEDSINVKSAAAWSYGLGLAHVYALADVVANADGSEVVTLWDPRGRFVEVDVATLSRFTNAVSWAPRD